MRNEATLLSLVLVLLLGISPLANAQTTWHVDCTAPPGGDGSAGNPFDTIQVGLDAALDNMFSIRIGGDTVEVADGTCNENLIWPDEIEGLVGANFLTLRSENGPAFTTIDGSGGTGDSPVISFAGLVGGLGNVVDGFTLTNPSGSADVINVAEGIVCDITIQNCILSNGYNGIGMLSIPAFGRITADQCTFVNNSNYGVYISGFLQLLFYTPTFTWITDCTFENNAAGAIWFMAGNCEITGNEVRNNHGPTAAIMAGTINLFDVFDPTSILIADNVVENNSGGGIGAFVPKPCTLTVSGNTVSGNYGTGDPAVSVGIAALGPASVESSFGRPAAGHILISRNTVSGPAEDPDGLALGISVQGCGATIDRNTVHGNLGGGPFSVFGHPADTLVSSGIAVQGWSTTEEDYPVGATITNNLIYGNRTGVFADYTVEGSSVILTNNTILDNVVGVEDYAVAEQSIITNCILWDNGDDLSNAVATYSDIQDGDTGTGNISAGPGFVGGGDYHLEAASPCVDTGNKGAPGIAGTLDIDGEARVMDGDANGVYSVDMGADELTGAADPCGGGGGGCMMTTNGEAPFGTNLVLSIATYLLPLAFVVILKRKYVFARRRKF